MKKRSSQGSADTVGVRELKAKLSAKLRQVRNGASLTVTDRGQPVARIIPAGISPGMERLMREGIVSWSGRKPVIEEPAIRLRGPGPSMSDIVSQMREEREQAIVEAVAPRRSRRPRRPR